MSKASGWAAGKASGWAAWRRQAAFLAVLVVAALIPGTAAGSPAAGCRGRGCRWAGTVLWATPLPGAWLASPGMDGTVPAGEQAYAAVNGRLAAVGAGQSVYVYRAADGEPLWTAVLTSLPAGSQVVSVRVWPAVVTVGVAVPAAGGGSSRDEVVLAAGTGRQLHVYPAAPFGGAVTAGPDRTVIVGNQAVTSYGRSGQVQWSRPTGPAAQAWQVDGGWLYMAVASGGYAGPAPVTALRKISLATGSEQLIRPRRGAFAGTLSLAFGGVVVFTGADGITAYSGRTGRVLWRRPGALPEGVDAAGPRIYLAAGNALLGVVPRTGEVETRVAGATAASGSGLYGVRAGTVFGLDHGAQGEAWGYSVTSQRVVWTSRSLPWPHYFVDLSGIGGSTTPGLDVVLLAVCARVGPAQAGSLAQPCARPELVAVSRAAATPVTPR